MTRRELLVALRRPGAALHYGLEDAGGGKYPRWWLEPTGIDVDAALAKAVLPGLKAIPDGLLDGAPPQSYT